MTIGLDPLGLGPLGLGEESAGGDVTAPVLSSPTGTATGSTTATVGATTDEGNGTLYAFVSTSATPPSDADLKAGTGAVWAGSQAVGSTGAKTLNATGLTASTGYYAHLLHTDAAANDSNIVTSAQFTTSAPAAPPVITVQPTADTVKNGQTAEFTITATGSGTVTYQWQEDDGGGFANISDGGAYSGATTDTLNIVTTRAMNGYDYRCNVSDDDAGPVASDTVALTVQQCVLALSAAGQELGDGNSPTTMAAENVVSWYLQVIQDALPVVSVVNVGLRNTGATGSLADIGDDALVFGTYYTVLMRRPASVQWTGTRIQAT